MNPRKITIKLLQENGYILSRHGGNHDIFFHPTLKTTIPVQRHNFNENTMRYILKQAGIQRREFS